MFTAVNIFLPSGLWYVVCYTRVCRSQNLSWRLWQSSFETSETVCQTIRCHNTEYHKVDCWWTPIIWVSVNKIRKFLASKYLLSKHTRRSYISENWPLSLHFTDCIYNPYLLTYLRSWALLEEPPIVQPLKKFPAFYGTRRVNTVFTRALHWSNPSHPISLRSILIL
jgi:hypothetical protein